MSGAVFKMIQPTDPADWLNSSHLLGRHLVLKSVLLLISVNWYVVLKIFAHSGTWLWILRKLKSRYSMNGLQVQVPVHLCSVVTKCQIVNIITTLVSHFIIAVTGSVTIMNVSMARHCEQLHASRNLSCDAIGPNIPTSNGSWRQGIKGKCPAQFMSPCYGIFHRTVDTRCRYRLNMYLKSAICHIMAKSHLIL